MGRDDDCGGLTQFDNSYLVVRARGRKDKSKMTKGQPIGGVCPVKFEY